MSFLRKIFQRGKTEDKKTGDIKKKPEETEKTLNTEKPLAKGGKAVLGVLRMAHITEKAANLNKKDKYVFKVDVRVNKLEIKRAVENRYGVRVKSVNIVNIPGKERKRGRQIGWKQGFKKAIVTLREGQTIEIQ